MPSDKPLKNTPNDKNEEDALERERQEALKKALLKLREQGKIKDLPSDLFGDDEISEEPQDATPPASATEQVEVPITTPPQPETSQTSDDVAETDAEKSAWSAVLSGWDTTPQRLEKEERKRRTAEIQMAAEAAQVPVTKHDTSEIEVVVTPDQDEKMAQVAVETAEAEKWGEWEDPAETSETSDESDESILDDWSIPEIIDEPSDEKAMVVRKQIAPDAEQEKSVAPPVVDTPWTLQQFFNGEIDLDVELQKRFPTIPIVSAVKFRTIGSNSRRRVATLTATDGSAAVIIDADSVSKEIQISFTFGSMLTLRYTMNDLSDADRTRWLDLMRRDKGGLAFLWGPTRWQKDYLICISRQYATKIYAFSPNNFESAIRLTQDVMDEVVNWLDEIWTFQPPDENDDAPLLTW